MGCGCHEPRVFGHQELCSVGLGLAGIRKRKGHGYVRANHCTECQAKYNNIRDLIRKSAAGNSIGPERQWWQRYNA